MSLIDERSLHMTYSEGITLFLDNSKPTQEAQTFLTWCVSLKLREKLQSLMHDGHSLYMLVAVVGPDNSEERMLFPFTDQKRLVQFFKKGVHDIHATVVALGDNKKAYNKFRNKLFEKKSNGSYRDATIWNGGTSGGDWISNEEDVDTRRISISYHGCGEVLDGIPNKGRSMISIDIPGGFFAKEARDAWWVNRSFDRPPRDNCDYRRRRMYAYSMQSFIFAFSTFVRLSILLVLAPFFFRELRFRAWHPSKMYEDVDDTYYFAKEDGWKSYTANKKDGSFRKFGFLGIALSPGITWISFLIYMSALSLAAIFSEKVSLSLATVHDAIIMALMFHVGILLLGVALTILIPTSGLVVNKIVDSAKWKEFFENREKRAQDRMNQADREYFDRLVCFTDPDSPNAQEMAPKVEDKFLSSLWLDKRKVRICKPFQS